jgi:diguanylate cyclase (GGDEF)-like protein
LIFTPVLLALMRGEFLQAFRTGDARARWEMAGLLLFTLLASLFVFFAMKKAMLFMLFAPVTLVTFRGGRLGLKAAVLIVAVVGIAATLSGAGPITRLTAEPMEQAILLQAFLATLLLCSLPAAAALEARRGAMAALAERQGLLEAREAELSVLAATDSLTGLLNRGAFRGRVEQALAGDKPACLLAIDLDRFKLVNDRYGHAAGDAALVHLARLLERHLRPGDIIGRLGGDEFMVLLPGAGADSADLVVRRLHAALRAAPLPLGDDVLLPLEMSIGLAVRQRDASLDSLAAEADAALYRAKFAGRRAA